MFKLLSKEIKMSETAAEYEARVTRSKLITDLRNAKIPMDDLQVLDNNQISRLHAKVFNAKRRAKKEKT